MRFVFQLYNYFLSSDRHFVKKIYNITGMMPREPELYKLAFRHSSMVTDTQTSALECNERLEYLGDAILGSIISEHLFKKYPLRNEGYLTEMRSKIVGRVSLNEIGIKLGLHELLQFNKKGSSIHRTTAGNTLEALVGAIYLDLGFWGAKKFVLKRILKPHFNLTELEDQNNNFKSQLLEYLQKHKMELPVYELLSESGIGVSKEFTIACKVGDEILGTGKDSKKKTAEQKASKIALARLLNPIGENLNNQSA